MEKNKKIILVEVILLIIILIIISVIVKRNIKQSDILIEIKDGTLSEDGVELVIFNNTGRYLYYGEWYEIEKKGIFGWNKIELDERDVALVAYKFYGKFL